MVRLNDYDKNQSLYKVMSPANFDSVFYFFKMAEIRILFIYFSFIDFWTSFRSLLPAWTFICISAVSSHALSNRDGFNKRNVYLQARKQSLADRFSASLLRGRFLSDMCKLSAGKMEYACRVQNQCLSRLLGNECLLGKP